ncbi:villin putative [Euphorbia peplus]|nr:villin putative [Euphorbia peplus]
MGVLWWFCSPSYETATNDNSNIASDSTKLFCVEKGHAEPVETDSLTRDLLDTGKCYILDCGLEVFVWMGRSTSLDDRRSASEAAEELVHKAE